ncbi:hypothetical protein JTF06_07990 [Desemzia sp. RIT804]|uniref:hypothetical protein n=1 Tax=Desemzia sp. RIT 804 TaxID=2810209 RepID=UPI00195019D0|nr:hypothetical protein [Desemzia sp. RIT 804]MBM6614830.1 hypothetical protein [Desemzia sp. RIT 804]
MEKAKLNNVMILDWLMALLITGIIVLIGNILGYGATITQSIYGILWLLLFTLGGLIFKQIIPLNLPAMAYISSIAILFSIPLSPVSDLVITHVEQISLLALCTPILAYAGVSIGKDWPAFRKIGYKGAIVSILVIMGTVLACVVFSEILFRIF